MKTLYFKRLNMSGEIESLMTYDYVPIITDPLIVEITEDEYNALLAEIQAADAPDPDEISDAEALDIILGVSE